MAALFGMLVILVIGSWYHMMEWWKSIARPRRWLYAILAVCFAGLVLSRLL